MPQSRSTTQSAENKSSQPHGKKPAPPSSTPATIALQSALADPLSASPAQVLQLQSQYGNRAVQRLIQRAHAEQVQPEASIGMEGGEVSGDLQSQISSARGGGQPLDRGVGSQIGGALGADFSGVKIHTDSKSDNLNRSLSAKAFTLGSDVFFSQGAYNPGTQSGKQLLAHELTHVVQQTHNQPGLQRQTDSVIQREHNFHEDENYDQMSVDMFSPAMDNSGAFVGQDMKRQHKRAKNQIMGGNWFTRLFKPSPSEVAIRIQMLRPRILSAFASAQANLRADTTLGIFMAPEWYFKRPNNPFTEADKNSIIQQLAAISAGCPNLLIIPGSIVWRGAGAGGNVMKNTAPIIMNGALLRTHDKQINAGDTDSYGAGAAAEYARGEGADSNFFSIGNVKFAIEICGDHSSRTRARNQFMENPPAHFDNGVDVHLLVSHGASIGAAKSLPKQGGYVLQSDASPHGAGADMQPGEKPQSMGISKVMSATGAQKQGAARKFYDLEAADVRMMDADFDNTHFGQFDL